jgi:hypothetical protein
LHAGCNSRIGTEAGKILCKLGMQVLKGI